MEVDQSRGVLHTILTTEELEAIPVASAKKLEDGYEQKVEEFLTAKALYETRKTDLEREKVEFDQKIEELTLKAQDESAKFHFSQQSVKELRIELEDVKQELIKTKERFAQSDGEATRLRHERNEAVDERDTLLSAIERKTLEVERLQADVLSLETKLKTSNIAKCEALAKIDEIENKEYNLEHKEKRMDRELSMRDNQIAKLTEDLDRAMHELQRVRREQNINSLTVDTKLTEKTEELKIAIQSIAHLKEQNGELSAKVDDLADKNMHLSNELTSMMEAYHKQSDSQTTLCNLLQQDKDDVLNQVKELESYITELRQMLEDATKSYGDLETEKKQLELEHTAALDEKDAEIAKLQTELNEATDLLKAVRDDHTEQALGELAPTAAATSHMIKAGMSLRDIYSAYVRSSEMLVKVEKEKKKLEVHLKSIVQELEERAPALMGQKNENQTLKETNEELVAQLNNMIVEGGTLREELANLQAKVRYLENQNKGLRSQHSDLGRQVCHLLHEVEVGRLNGSIEEPQNNGDPIVDVPKDLITFDNITQLHKNNIKLLLVVRDFSKQIEDLKTATNSMSTVSYEAKVQFCDRRIEEQQQAIEKQRQMLEQCTQQRNRYKKMYHDAMRSYNPAALAQQSQSSMNGANAFDEPMMMDEGAEAPTDNNSGVAGGAGPRANEGNAAPAGAAVAASLVAEKERRIGELEAKLKEQQQQLATLKEEYETYRREKLTNDKMLNEQFDQMRTELRELTCKNVTLMGTGNFNVEQNRMMVKNIATFKNQIQTLEERNKNYESTIAKHEATIMYLKDETMSAQSKLARSEVVLENLKHECRMLKDNESRLQTEREILNRERHGQSLLLNNLEMIKVSMERSENEGRLRLESRLDETSRECSALRRRLQEEQDRFREQTGNFQRQAETARKRMEEEIAIAETVQAELHNARDELEIKARKVDELQRKLQETLSPNDEDNPVTQANRKVRELERELGECRVELEAAVSELASSKEHVKQYADLAESGERELKDLNELYTRYRESSEAELAALRKRVEELTAQMHELKTEMSLKVTGAQLTAASDKESELHQAQLALQDALQRLAEQNREMREMREKCTELLQQVETAEAKYANEIMQHSQDIQQLAQLKEEMQRVRGQFDELVQERDRAVERLQMGEEGWSRREELLRAESAQLEERVDNLNSQNGALHDQIQSLSMRLSMSTVALNQSATEAPSIADDSMGGAVGDCSLLSRSITEDEKHSVEQLLQIMKYLRKEKDIAVARYDLLRSENVRFQSELMMFQKRCEEAQAELAAAREKSDTGVVTAAKHEEILRKLEMYNAITDSNRVLREERDGLIQKAKELSDRVLKAQDEMFPLQERVLELQVKLDSATSENATLRVEATRWRQRANLLVERSNKTNPDDWKRMQTERENLAKMLMAEKEQLKHSNDELNAIRQERARLEAELATVTKQLAATSEQSKKLAAELETTIAQGGAALEALKAEMKTKEEHLQDAKNKEQQIRKIAKRYKDTYNQLRKEVDDKESAASTGSAAATAAGAAAAGGDGPESAGAPSTSAAEFEELRKKLESAVEEVDTLQKENELLRAQLDKAERNQELLKEAKHRILTVTEQKNAVARELTTLKAQLQQQLEQVREENELLKSQYEGRVSRFEKESADAERESKEALARLNRDNEQLVIRLNQLTRQLGLQQAAKPSTSAVGAGSGDKPPGESPRTANVKPMAGPSSQQSATVTPRRVNETTPLASIRPMAVGSRTAAVLPTSQSTTNVAIVQGSTSSTSAVAAVAGSSGASTTGGSILPTVSAAVSVGVAAAAANSTGVAGSASGSGVPSSAVGSGSSASASTSGLPTTALVPPQQQVVHSATATSSSSSSSSSGSGSSNSVSILSESMASSSPTSSHTDYMPATSSASVAVAAVPPMGTASTSSNAAESSSSTSTTTSQMVEGESLPQMGSSVEAGPPQQAVQQQPATQQAAVAMVLPQVEGGVSQQHQAQAQQQQQQQQQLQQQQQQHQQLQQQQLLQQPQQLLAQPQQAQLQQLAQSVPQASSSNTVTTTQAGHKRPRDVEGDSSTDTVGQQSTSSKAAPAKKRVRVGQVAGDAFQGVSESGLDVEYQVPTSSQRDQEDDIVVVDSEEEDEEEDDDDDEEEEEDVGMPDEGTAEADDGPYEGYEAEESYEPEGPGVAGGVGAYDEGEGPDIDEDNNIQSANNEVDVDDDNEMPSASGTTSSTSQQQQQQPMETADVETSSTSSTTTTTTAPGGGLTTSTAAAAVVAPGPSISTSSGSSSSVTATGSSTSNDAQQQPQIQSTTGAGAEQLPPTVGSVAGSGTVPPLLLPTASSAASSSGTSATVAVAAASAGVASAMGGAVASGSGGVATTRQVVIPFNRQQQAAHLLLLQQQNYDHEGADDRNVPSTPTLYAPRRTDGFSEAVSSPHPQVPNARFTFGETASSRQSVGVVPTSVGSGSGGAGGGASSGPGGNVMEQQQQQHQQQQQMLPAGIDDTRIDLSQLDEAASGGSSSGGGRSVPTTPHHTTGDHGYIPESTSGGGGGGGNGGSSSSSSSSAGIISTSSVVTTMEEEPHLLLESNTSEAQASSGTASGSGIGSVGSGGAIVSERDRDRSEKELLEEDDDDDDDDEEDDDAAMVVATTDVELAEAAAGGPPAATVGSGGEVDDDDDDVDDDVEMGEPAAGGSKQSIPTMATTGTDDVTASGSTSSTVATPSSASGVGGSESPAGRSGGRPVTPGHSGGRGGRANEPDRGPGDDGVTSEGEKMLKTTPPMEEGREAEVLETPSSNTRSRSSSSNIPRGGNPARRGRRPGNRGNTNRTPITWNDGRSSSYNRSGPPGMGSPPPQGIYQPPHMMQQQQQQMQQHQQQQQQQQQRRPTRSRGRRQNAFRYQ